MYAKRFSSESFEYAILEVRKDDRMVKLSGESGSDRPAEAIPFLSKVATVWQNQIAGYQSKLFPSAAKADVADDDDYDDDDYDDEDE
jgi:hypothetical protein